MKALMKKMFAEKKHAFLAVMLMTGVFCLLPIEPESTFLAVGTMMLVSAVVQVNECSVKDMVNEKGMPVDPADPARARFCLSLISILVLEGVTALFHLGDGMLPMLGWYTMAAFIFAGSSLFLLMFEDTRFRKSLWAGVFAAGYFMLAHICWSDGLLGKRWGMAVWNLIGLGFFGLFSNMTVRKALRRAL